MFGEISLGSQIIIGFVVVVFVAVAIIGAVKRERIEEKVNKWEDKLVTCETCGYAVLKEDARRGESEVRSREANPFESGIPKDYFTQLFMNISVIEEYIYIPYYCKRCNNAKQTTDKKANSTKRRKVK